MSANIAEAMSQAAVLARVFDEAKREEYEMLRAIRKANAAVMRNERSEF